MSNHRHSFVALVLLSSSLSCVDGASDGPIEFTPLDDFEDASAWLKGDPKTDLEQKDTAVRSSTEVVREGKRSLAFIVHVNWTPRPGQKYAKGWPMMTRRFDEPVDWSTFDYLNFWLYAKTDCDLLQPRVLRVGVAAADGKKTREWYTIPGIRPNKWQEIVVPLTMPVDWKQVGGIAFYVAEAWYDDGDKVEFYLDDMRLSRRTAPAFAGCSATARILPRGQAVELAAKIVGPPAGVALRCTLLDGQGQSQVAKTAALQGKEQSVVVPLGGVAAGGHHARAELVDADGKILDTWSGYFRSLQPGKRCYLKLITFYTKPLDVIDLKAAAVLNDSAYAGVAIPLLGSYSTEPIPPFESLKPRLAEVRDAVKIDLWPWVAVNRLIGAPEDGHGHAGSHAKDLSYFTKIRTLDLDTGGHARSDFLHLWRNALQAARFWKSPGVMIDLEAYNNYRAYNVDYVARKRGETVDAVIEKCEALGADLARSVGELYPACTVWSLFSRLERSSVMSGRDERIWTTSSYITLGLLRHAKANGIPLKFLCGGETTPGYCNKTVDELKWKIAERDEAVAPFLEEFRERFFLAGTISPFHDYEITTGWIQKKYKGTGLKTIEDFEPFFRTLFDAYDWVWIYASSAAKTMPYKAENNTRYSRILREALAASAGGGQ